MNTKTKAIFGIIGLVALLKLHQKSMCLEVVREAERITLEASQEV